MSHAGAGGLLLDVSGDVYCSELQARLWSVARLVAATTKPVGVEEAIVGINNILLVFDPVVLAPAEARDWLASAWQESVPGSGSGRRLGLGMSFDASSGPDLTAAASQLQLRPVELVALLCEQRFTVASLGAMPGFAYMTGLPAALALPRRATPRGSAPAGSLILGPGMVAILPCASPTGWHVVGGTQVALFDPLRQEPAFFRLGDEVHFEAEVGP